MVYLARTEDSDQAIIEWKVDLSARKLSIKDVKFRGDTKLYENATIVWEFLTNTGGLQLTHLLRFCTIFSSHFLKIVEINNKIPGISQVNW